MTRQTLSLLQRIKDLWPLYGIAATICGLILLWGNLPKRVDKVEAGQAKQEEELDDLKGWARELQGYTRAQQQMNQQQQLPSLSNPPAPVPPQAYDWWQDPTTGEWWWCDLSTDCDQDANWWLEE